MHQRVIQLFLFSYVDKHFIHYFLLESKFFAEMVLYCYILVKTVSKMLHKDWDWENQDRSGTLWSETVLTQKLKNELQLLYTGNRLYKKIKKQYTEQNI